MNKPEETPRTSSSIISAEALIGIGVTLGALGVLFLLLGLAQSMRQVPASALILGSVGGGLFVVGLITGLIGRGKRA
ncbi:MAG: hypothetical protein ABI992_02070 [Chthoniobacterales bacterium]